MPSKKPPAVATEVAKVVHLEVSKNAQENAPSNRIFFLRTARNLTDYIRTAPPKSVWRLPENFPRFPPCGFIARSAKTAPGLRGQSDPRRAGYRDGDFQMPMCKVLPECKHRRARETPLDRARGDPKPRTCPSFTELKEQIEERP